MLKALPQATLALVVESVIDVGPGGGGLTGPPPLSPPPPHPRARERTEKAARAVAARNLLDRPGVATAIRAASSITMADPHGLLQSGTTRPAWRGFAALEEAPPMGVMLSVTDTGPPLRLTEAGLSEML